ncbi:hypothetical protein NDU88_007824 [Pleurodeles waltl]|uniref:Uncharacterized protein n=1 Tax=Pleurodeles waltl TaxID=8319 RepID=A0AAV7NVZ7_PLEWA|nr:hypothetical protein NDU88_007824 [Pleurodeles waltl]
MSAPGALRAAVCLNETLYVRTLIFATALRTWLLVKERVREPGEQNKDAKDRRCRRSRPREAEHRRMRLEFYTS